MKKMLPNVERLQKQFRHMKPNDVGLDNHTKIRDFLNHLTVYPIILTGVFGETFPIKFKTYSTVRDWQGKAYLDNLKTLLSWVLPIKLEDDPDFAKIWAPLTRSIYAHPMPESKVVELIDNARAAAIAHSEKINPKYGEQINESSERSNKRIDLDPKDEHEIDANTPRVNDTKNILQCLSDYKNTNKDELFCDYVTHKLGKISLKERKLIDCDFSKVNLIDADMQGSTLNNSKFHAAILLRTNLYRWIMKNCDGLVPAQLAAIKGLLKNNTGITQAPPYEIDPSLLRDAKSIAIKIRNFRKTIKEGKNSPYLFFQYTVDSDIKKCQQFYKQSLHLKYGRN